jgi:hypothetical protein
MITCIKNEIISIGLCQIEMNCVCFVQYITKKGGKGFAGSRVAGYGFAGCGVRVLSNEVRVIKISCNFVVSKNLFSQENIHLFIFQFNKYGKRDIAPRSYSQSTNMDRR